MASSNKDAFPSTNTTSVSTDLPLCKKRDIKRSLLTHAAFAIVAVLIYRGICSFLMTFPGHNFTQSASSPVAKIERRDVLDHRAAADKIWNQVWSSRACPFRY
jgi:hypothetical protein